MSFAALQSRVNAAASAKLLTDAATLNGVAVTGKFLNESEIAMRMIGGSNPVFECPTSLSGSSAKGRTLITGGVSYTVIEAKPDNTPDGFTLLELEQA